MPFNEENLLKKIGKWFGEQYRLSREAEEKVAKKFGVVPMPAVGGVSRMPSIFGKTGAKIIREVLKDIGKPLTGEELERAVMSSRYKLGMRSAQKIADYLKVNLQVVKDILKKYK